MRRDHLCQPIQQQERRRRPRADPHRRKAVSLLHLQEKNQRETRRHQYQARADPHRREGVSLLDYYNFNHSGIRGCCTARGDARRRLPAAEYGPICHDAGIDSAENLLALCCFPSLSSRSLQLGSGSATSSVSSSVLSKLDRPISKTSRPLGHTHAVCRWPYVMGVKVS